MKLTLALLCAILQVISAAQVEIKPRGVEIKPRIDDDYNEYDGMDDESEEEYDDSDEYMFDDDEYYLDGGDDIDADMMGRKIADRQVDALPCNGKDKLQDGEVVSIETPNYPEPYPNKKRCKWSIKIPKESTVYIYCEQFNLEKGDYLRIQKTKYSGLSGDNYTSFEPLTNNKRYTLRLQFKSNKKRNNTGFKCYIAAESGNGTATTTTTMAPPTTSSGNSSETCTCGKPYSSTRIVGGQETQVHEYPWQVGLVSKNGKTPWCGGTLISDRHVLTAAHCTAGESTKSMKVLLGEHQIDDNTYTIVPISKITDDPLYNDNNYQYDFSILTLKEPVQFSAAIAPACMPSYVDQDFAGMVATVSGWGTLTSGGNQPTVLHSVDVTVTTNAECQQAYGSNIGDMNICAADSGKDSCQGDSGGPLVMIENGRYVIAGVVSWGYGCAYDGYPGVYARTTARRDWILANTAGTQDSTACLPAGR